MSVIYRKAAVGDLEAIYHIETTCFKLPWSYESLRSDICDNELAYYIVAEADGIVAGYCGVHIIYNEGHIMNVAVLPEYRRRGIGQGLLETLFTQTRLPFFTLEVRVSNESAISLYRKFGFVPLGRRPKYYGDEDALIMWKGKNAP